MKIGYAVTFHFSENRSESLKEITQNSISSFYDSCNYNFSSYIIDNQSTPKDSFKDIIDISTENMKYTYIEDQYKKGLTGAWNLSIKQAIDDKCDFVMLVGDDIIFDNTINNLIEHAINDKLNDNSIYVPVAANIAHPMHQLANAVTGKVYQTPGVKWGEHVSPIVVLFSKEFYYSHCNDQGDLFQVDNKYNGGDGKWGGQEGNLQEWAEQGTRNIVVGTSWVEHKCVSTQGNTASWREARAKDRGQTV